MTQEEDLVALYGVAKPYGTLARGDGSERCVVCRWRSPSDSFYVWLPAPFPVCGPEHAAIERQRIEAALEAAREDQRVEEF